MIPIGKQMAEALLEESDESTLSLSDHESIEGEAAVSSGYPNPKAKPFMPFHVDRGYNGGVTMPTITGTALELEKWFSSLRNVSQSPHMSALLLKNDRIMSGACHHVALDCESEYKAYSRHCVLTIDLAGLTRYLFVHSGGRWPRRLSIRSCTGGDCRLFWQVFA